jgi:hypothetical protein
VALPCDGAKPIRAEDAWQGILDSRSDCDILSASPNIELIYILSISRRHRRWKEFSATMDVKTLGRAVIGAAVAYVRANKASLVQEVAAAVGPERMAPTGTETAPEDQIIVVRPRAKRRPAGGRNEIAGTHNARA